MQVHWKALIGFGFAFWVLLCAEEFYFGDVTKIIKYDEEDRKSFELLGDEEEVEAPPPQKVFPQQKLSSTQWIFWNIGAFFTSAACSFLLKLILSSYGGLLFASFTNSETTQTINGRASSRSLLSRIPIPIYRTGSQMKQSNLESDTKTEVNESCLSLTTASTDKENDTKSFTSRSYLLREAKSLDKFASKTQNNIVKNKSDLVVKEHFALNKKVDHLSKEKRDLLKQLMIAKKENREMKQQLDELMNEKAMLIKRLDSAAKEFKINVKSKKGVIEQLEQAESQIYALKEQLMQSKKQKYDLEMKLKVVEEKMQRSNAEAAISSSFISRSNSELAYAKNLTQEGGDTKFSNSLAESVEKRLQTTPRMPDISQNRVDVQKVQMRLKNLERSLERFRESTFLKKETPKVSNKTSPNSSEACSPRIELSSTVQNDGELEVPKETPTFETQNAVDVEMNDFLNLSDNLTDEQRQEILNPQTPKNHPLDTTETSQDDIKIFDRSPESQVNIMLSFYKTVKDSVKENNTGNEFCTDEESVSIESTVNNSQADEDSKEYDEIDSSRRRLVSSSPAFQKFLKNMDPSESFHNIVSPPFAKMIKIDDL